MKIEDIMSQFSGKGVPWGPTLTPSAAEELELYLKELVRETFKEGFKAGCEYVLANEYYEVEDEDEFLTGQIRE